MPFLIVEYSYEPPVTDEQLAENSAKLGNCLEVRNVKWVQSYVSDDRKKGMCIFEAIDAETVRSAYRAAQVKFERVWPAFAPWA